MDGLDPMIVWGMGGRTGHTAIALWIEDELYVTESTVTSAYWPTNGIQKTPWAQWINQSLAADYQVVHVPLDSAHAQLFNADDALAFFNKIEGMPYGYHNFFFGWIDTPEDNFPCMPPNYDECLTNELLYIGAGLFDRLDQFIANRMWNQALCQRLGIKWGVMNETLAILQYAWEQKQVTFADLITQVEMDGWMYSDGYSMTCDVFVCSMWKAGGMFGDLSDSIQCAEFTPWDVYTLNFFDAEAQRPVQCIEADPDLPFCQLMGHYQLSLPNYNTKAPYANMAQNCPGVPPLYTRASNC
jgi:hypothetical protein